VDYCCICNRMEQQEMDDLSFTRAPWMRRYKKYLQMYLYLPLFKGTNGI
jgi:hypothetical protein